MEIGNLHANWVDLVIIIILIYFAVDAWRTGFWIILADFISFLFSLLIALTGFSFFAGLLEKYFSLGHSLANALGFFVAAALSEAVLGFVMTFWVTKIPYKLWKKPWNNIVGIFPALGQALILISFLLTMIISLPVTPVVKRDVVDSTIGNYLVRRTSGIESQLKLIFGGLAEDALTYLTVKPGSNESVAINAGIDQLSIDNRSESEMFKLVNQERTSRGLMPLTWREEVVSVARGHAKDMWERGYFGHNSPEGYDVSTRLQEAKVKYGMAGENLALAPTLATSHTGLMNSEGHRKNILDKDFRQIGIGVIDNGIYGKMFVQIFTD